VAPGSRSRLESRQGIKCGGGGRVGVEFVKK